MKLSSVRELQERWVGRTLVSSGVLEEDLPDTATGGLRALVAATVARSAGTLTFPSRCSVSVGIAGGRAKHDFVPAVRVIGTNADEFEVIRKEVERETRGECDVKHLPEVRAQSSTPQWLQGRQRPLEPGLSVGHFAITAGTLGGFVQDSRGVYILSNNHVLADTNDGEVDDPVVQPGPLDQGKVADDSAVAVLSRFVPIRFHSGVNKVDAAIAALLPDVEYYPKYNGALDGLLAGVGELTEQDAQDRVEVVKIGRTTGVTRGRITAVDLKGLQIDMSDTNTPRIATFDEQVEIEAESGSKSPFSRGGDSGSMIVRVRDRRAVALLFAGETRDRISAKTFANPLVTVLGELGVRLAS